MMISTSSAAFLLIIVQSVVQHGRASVLSRSNPCIAYSSCIGPVAIPTTRVMTTLFSLNFFKFANGEFLTDICPELEEKSSCESLLLRCKNEDWPEAASFQTSDFQLALWVCTNKATFEANTACWEDPFLTEMTSCTGLEHFLQPTECLTDKIQDLENCAQDAKDLFQELLTAAHAS